MLRKPYARKSLHISQVLFIACISFCVGVAEVPTTVMLASACVATVVLVLFSKCKFLAVVFLATSMLCSFWLGQTRYAGYAEDVSTIPFDEKVTFTGYINKPPQHKPDSQVLRVAVDGWPGGVRVKADAYPQFSFGDVVDVRCTLRQPEPFDDFAYDAYLIRHDTYATCGYADVEFSHTDVPLTIIERAKLSILQPIYRLRNAIQVRIEQLWREPIASLYLGVIIGLQDTIPSDLQEAFRVTGTIHVLVVSGMHVAILVQLMSSVLERYLSPRVRWVCIALGVIVLAVITGLQASVIRAGIMGMIPLTAYVLGRPTTSHYALASIATLMIAINPYILVYDMGFQLSFLATLGLLYIDPLLRPLVNRLLGWVPEQLTLQETLSTTVAATAATTPLILYQFGTFSVVGVLANSIVVPVTNIMLFAGSGIALLSVLHFGIAQWFAILLHWPVQIIIWFVEWLAAAAWVQLQDIQLSFAGMLLCYVVMVCIMVYSVYRKNRYAA